MTTPSVSASHVLAVLEAERQCGFAGLAGTSVDLTVPLRQAALDALIGQVQGWPDALDAIAVQIGDANRLVVAATIRMFGFRKSLHLQLRLAPSMEDGVVRLVIDDGSLMGSAVALLGPLLGSLPDGVVLNGRQVTVDVRRLASQQGIEDLAAMVSRATFASSPGVLWVTVQARAPGAAPAATRRTPRSSSEPLAFDLASVRAWLQGSLMEVDVHIDERLANELLTALHADAQRPSGDPVRDMVTGALHPPVVRFDAGVMRVTARGSLDAQPAADGR